MHSLLLDPADVAASIPMSELVDAVESAFAADARGNTEMPAKSYIDLPQYDGDFRSMPAYVETEEWEGAGLKWVNSHVENPDRHDLPTVIGTMVYSDPETAYPLALLDGTTLTRLRTGAAAAVATNYLACKDATSLGLVGAGAQSHSQLEAIATVREVETVVAADRREEAIDSLLEEYGDRFDIRGGSIAEAATCDIVSTTTPVREPIVETVGEQTHVNAMGADAAGKQEIAVDILQDATIVIDNYEQCTHSGEINVPWSEGQLTDTDIHAELGEVVTGRAQGRGVDDGVTLFDSTGLAIQDIAAAHVAYERAAEEGLGTEFSLVGTDAG